MLSICVPVYNYNISDLIEKLSSLSQKLRIPYQIVVADDCSEQSIQMINKEKAEAYGITYLGLNKNIGRSAIRNLLCKEAAFDNLLFLDCDSIIHDESYLTNYQPYFNKNVVVYGGTKYQEEVPEAKYLLHWNYGLKREIKPAIIRNKSPFKYFKTNNFLISKQILTQYPFNEVLKGYGHEDTLLGIELYRNEIPIVHIENEVMHSGLETNEKFLLKTETAVKNLCLIEKEVGDNEILYEYIHLYKVFSQVKKLKMISLVKLFWKISRLILVFLIFRFYSMKALDVYKLGFICSIQKKHRSCE